MKKQYLGLGVLVILVAAGTYLATGKLLTPKAFIVHQIQRVNGQETKQITRSYKATGEWMETQTDIKTGSKNLMFGTRDAGVVRVNDVKKENEFVGGWAMPITAEQIKSDPNFIGESEVLGYQVLQVRLESKTDGSVTDLYRAPALYGMILKTVVTDADGGGFTVEPERVDLAPVDFAIPTYPVTRDTYNSTHHKN